MRPSLETRKKLSDAAKKQWAEGRGCRFTSEYCKRMAESVKRAHEDGKIWGTIPFERRGKKFRVKYLLDKHGNRCMICGSPPEWQGQPLQFQEHHVDGDRKNNSEGNIQIVCPNCHSQSVTWCGRNNRK